MASNIKTTPWYRRMLGPDLIQCSTVTEKDIKLIPVDSVLDTCVKVLGLYFTPIVGVDEVNSTALLVDLYKHVNVLSDNNEDDTSGAMNRKQTFEIIQIVFSSNADSVVSITDVEESFKKLIKDLPWFAVPYHDYHRKGRLSRRYRAKSGAPTLVLLEAASGKVITSSGCERLETDPAGERFPWRPRPVLEVLKSGGLITSENTPCPAIPQGTITGLYFSAHWCPPCKAFTPQLVHTYTKVRERGHRFEVIFVSSDRSEESFSQYLATMPWLAIPYEDDVRRRELASLFSVQGIPTLVLLDADGHLITDDGRGEVNEDPDGLSFPWYPKLVNILTERHAAKLHDHPAIILFVEGDDGELEFAESVLLPAAEEYRMQYHLQDDDDFIQFFIGCDCDTSDLLREFIGIDDAVPLLTAIDIPSGRMGVMEDDEEITEDSVKRFVARFLDGSLMTTDIVSNTLNMNIGGISVI
ncbi:nucleoredoxin [Anabrus simplex]|uniref:nucleoredoxin n=1 Tax=Anabrus simplex TaxID=316456 RepID=UPI0035A398E6